MSVLLSGAVAARGSSSGEVADAVVGAGAPSTTVAGEQPVVGSGAGPGPQRYAPLFRRTAGRVAVRAYQQDRTCQGPGCPPAECDPPQLIGALSNEGAVGQLSAPSYSRGETALLVGATVFGVEEGDPAFAAAVRAADPVRSLRLEAAGRVYEMAPVGGWALLVVPLAATLDPAGLQLPQGRVRALGASGRVLADLSLAQPWVEPPASCVPDESVRRPAPPPLPPPGTVQPSDPAAAREGVRAAYAAVFTGANPPEVKRAALEDREALVPALEGIAARFPEAARTVTVEVGDIVFTSEFEAFLRFDLTYRAGADFGVTRGRAVFLDGRWRVGNDTLCTVAGWAGVRCPAG